MTRTTLFTTGLLAALVSAWFGCNSARDSAPAAAEALAQPETGNSENAENRPDLATLSEEDRQFVLTQKVCPVSGKPLGSMGTPIKVKVDGRHLFICCKGCEDSAKEKFDEYYSNLEKSATSRQAN